MNDPGGSRGPRRLFRLPFRGRGVEEDVDEEIRFHIEERTAHYERLGMSPDEARRAARRRFGDVERVRADVEGLMKKRERAMRTSSFTDNARRDVAFAVRQIFRNPGFSLVAVLTISLAIGATTSIFSVVDGIMLRALPYDEPDELVMVWADYTRRDVVLPDKRREWMSWPNFSDFRDEVSAVESVSAFLGWNPTLTGSGTAEQLSGSSFSYGMFSEVLDVEPALGRLFRPEEDVPDGPPVAVISHGFWQRAFGSDPAILDRPILLNDTPYSVIGVMPADFRPPPFLGRDAWTTLRFDMSNGGGRGSAFLRAVGRLAEDASLETARDQARQLGLRLEREYPESNVDTGFNVYPLHDDMVQQASTALWVLLGAVGFVLLIACVNVANLLLARGGSRASELAVRVAMGAGRRRVFAQLLTESLILSGLGGLVGFALAFLGTEALVAIAPPGTPLIDQVAVDLRILGFAIAITMLAGVLFGILPAIRASQARPASALRAGGRSGDSGGSGRLRNALVVGQIALALMLLVGGGLLIRSFQNLSRVDLGFDPEGVLVMQMALPQVRFPDAQTRIGFFQSVEERLEGIPGVDEVGSVSALPLAGNDSDTGFFVEGATPPQRGLEPSVWFRRVTPGYFEATGLQVLEGRSFTESDDREATRVVMVNETIQRDYFDGRAVGKRINLNDPENPIWREVVGVVKDIKNFGIRAESRNALYLPYAQAPSTFMYVTVRASVEPTSLMNPVRSSINEIDPGIAVAGMQPMRDYVEASLQSDRFTTTLLAGFAFVALVLAVVGLYGVVSYSVNTRMREMGIRIALGAEGRGIRAMVIRWALGLAAVGIVAGALGALGLTRMIDGLLFGVASTDAPTFGAVALIMAGAALLASFVPAARATRVDPIKVLKTE